MSLKLREVAPSERPRERLLALGPGALTVVELLAILIGTGTRDRDAAGVAANLLADSGGSLRSVARKTVSSLARTAGVGRTKAARVVAALELARRCGNEAFDEAPLINSPDQIWRLFRQALSALDVEEFHLVALDARNRVVRKMLITRGILNSSLVHPREVFRPAIVEAAAGVIVVHNHPSGNPQPSREDRHVTGQLVQAGRTLDIPLYDHVIVAHDGYFSFSEAGEL